MQELVRTSLGRLNVGQIGSGPPALLWHSLWVDSRSWGPLADALGAHRRLVVVDGPGYGGSDPIHRDFTLDDCARAAVDVLDQLGIDEPVDWVGNAWGGHVGITLAAERSDRVRSLVTINAPLLPVGRRQRWTTSYPLALLYRLTGPSPVIAKPLFDTLLGAEAFEAQPDRAAEMVEAFLHADRESMRRTIRFMHRWQPLTDKLPAITAPTLFLTGDVDGQQWSPAEAEAAAATMPDARVVRLRGAGHVSPLLLDTDLIANTVADFWRSP
ncbi:alpha/beta hydrolase [Candidatus Mycobacterium wuenschmannii]|uniref:Alpha/beta hydrolase n=1 Tax=Candidatus Mycobacterium wuenschmannii TaxID=3027808 RepID=A0ABY8W019_9MYCO|nr:alpha/beta hydrolase [Candidatus Mycobacterium wuenschmannii]WIM88570.1 alpha/beta hydrolase [Candidatus Mycobacterium wuenschmannii]